MKLFSCVHLIISLLLMVFAGSAFGAQASRIHSTPSGNTGATSSPFQNFEQLISGIDFDSFASTTSVRHLKIAILDNGFRGAPLAIGKTLPKTTTLHMPVVAAEPGAIEDEHGLVMAQLLSAAMAKAPGIDYEMHLYPTFGYSNFSAAVGSVAKNHFDLVLYAQVWEYGGNGDGKGFINTAVNQALRAGVTWVNAAGNFATGTFQAAVAPSVASSTDHWVKLPGPNDAVRVRCSTSKAGGTCPLRAILSWNDFKDDVQLGTDKDLDLILTDDTLRILTSSAFVQMKEIPEPAPAGASLYPREIVQTAVSAGVYFLRIKQRSQNFNPKYDRLRLNVSGGGIELIDWTQGESLLPPADNPGVITVGATDSELSSWSKSLARPDLLTPSRLILQNGDVYEGSSISAAIAASAVIFLKALDPSMDRNRLITLLGAGGSTSPVQGQAGLGLPLEVLDFAPQGSADCFRPAQLKNAPTVLKSLMADGAQAVSTTRGVKIFTSFDPFQATGNLPVSFDDMLVADANGFETLPRSNQPYLIPGSYEVVQTPRDQLICETTDASGGSETPNIGHLLRLPHH